MAQEAAPLRGRVNPQDARLATRERDAETRAARSSKGAPVDLADRIRCRVEAGNMGFHLGGLLRPQVAQHRRHGAGVRPGAHVATGIEVLAEHPQCRGCLASPRSRVGRVAAEAGRVGEAGAVEDVKEGHTCRRPRHCRRHEEVVRDRLQVGVSAKGLEVPGLGGKNRAQVRRAGLRRAGQCGELDAPPPPSPREELRVGGSCYVGREARARRARLCLGGQSRWATFFSLAGPTPSRRPIRLLGRLCWPRRHPGAVASEV